MWAFLFIMYMLFIRIGYMFVSGRCCDVLGTQSLRILNWFSLAVSVLLVLLIAPITVIAIRITHTEGFSWLRTRLCGFLDENLRSTCMSPGR